MSRQPTPRVQPLLKKIQGALGARLPLKSSDRRDTSSEALEVWQRAGVIAWKSLRDEMIRDATSAGRTPMPRTDPSQGRMFLRVIEELRSDPDPIGEIWEALSDWLQPAQGMTPIQKRLRFRQSLIAAGILLDAQDRAAHALRLEAESLRLDPLDLDWVDGVFE